MTTARLDYLYILIQGLARRRDAGGGAGLNVCLAEGDGAGFDVDARLAVLSLQHWRRTPFQTKTIKAA